MTTTQPTEFTDKYDHRFRVEDDGVSIIFGTSSFKFFFDSPEQACRAALAILTGPGKVVPDESAFARIAAAEDAHIAFGAHQIREGLTMKDEAVREAAADSEAAELRAEALAILNAMDPDCATDEWQYWGEYSQAKALNAARAAREARRLHTNKEARA